MKNLLLIITTTLLFACNSQQESTQAQENESKAETSFAIDRPKVSDSRELQLFKVSSREGKVIKTKNESIIVIPKDAFVYEDGTEVNGEVEIAYEEFFGVADIISSGIPMTVMVDNEPTPFISDGMFDIKGSCGGKGVKLKKDKQLGVFTTSLKADPDFKYWKLDETNGSWEKTGARDKTLAYSEVRTVGESINPIAAQKLAPLQPQGTSNRENKAKLESLKLTKPTPPVKAEGSDFTFTIDASKSVYKELEAYTNVVWMPEEVLIERKQQAFANDLRRSGADIKISCLNDNDQLYELSYGGKKMKMRPVLLGPDKAKALARFKERKKIYDQKMLAEKQRVQRERAAQVNSEKVYNYFRVNSMGIYNCDRYYKYSGQRPLFTFNCNNDEVNNHIFAVLKNDEGVVVLSSAYMENGKFKLPADEIASFVHTSAKGELMFVKPDNPIIGGVNKRDFTMFNPIANSESIKDLISTF